MIILEAVGALYNFWRNKGKLVERLLRVLCQVALVSRDSLLEIPWTVAHQALLSMESPRQ